MLEAICFHLVLVLLKLRIDGCPILFGRICMTDEAELDRLCQALRLLRLDGELVGLRVALDAEGGVPNDIDVSRDARHDKVVQVVVEGCRTLLQPLVGRYDGLVAITGRQSDNLLCKAHIFDQLVWRLAEREDVTR